MSRTIHKIHGGWLAIAVWVCGSVASAGAPSASNDKKPDFPPFEEVTKDTKTIEGFMTLYHDEKTDRLLLRVPQKQMGKNILLATSFAAGPVFAGWQWADGVVYWERHGKQLILMNADPRYEKGKGSTVEDVIGRTYTDTIVKALPLVTETGGDAVVDLGELLKSDLLQVGRMYRGRLDSNLARYGKIKNFEQNTEISVDAPVMLERGGPIVRLHYSFSHLPENNSYKPREADPRIGYFIVARKDYSAAHDEPTVFKRYINRWRLRKAETGKDVSDVLPEDQIIFYIEKTVPVKYRSAVREGILEWNKAFEAAGLRNALIVRQQTDSNEFKDIDPEDVRYNFFRWIVSGIPFAMGPSRANPFTGQILDADIIMDDSMVRYNLREYGVHAPQPAATFTDGFMREFLAHHPQWDYLDLDVSPPGPDPAAAWTLLSQTLSGLAAPDAPSIRAAVHAHAPGACELGAGLARQLAFASFVSAAAGADELPEQFIFEAIKETVMHEVGHTLGLRHNFKASSWLDLEEIKRRRTETDLATTASVMDYNPYTYSRDRATQGAFATPTLGPYDYWAIEYGYRHFMPGGSGSAPPPATPAPDAPADVTATNGTKAQDGPAGEEPSRSQATVFKSEREMLAAIASRGAEPGHDYATDEDTSFFMPDPTVNRWDNGRDPLVYAKERMEAAHRLWKDGLEWAIKEGNGFQRLRVVLDMLLGDFGYVGMTAARLVGGQYIHRDHKGDPGDRQPIEVVPASRQREALHFLRDTVLADKFFEFSPELLRSMGPGRWWHWDSDAFDFVDVSYDVHERILRVQMRVLFMLLNPFTLNRVYDSTLLARADEDYVSVPEVFGATQEMVWSDLERIDLSRNYTDRRPLISSYRRALQRHHVQMLINMTLEEQRKTLYPDVQAMARLTLKELGATIDKTLTAHGSRLDDFSRGHLLESGIRITKALEAKYAANSESHP